jgi:hypothetical protein
MIYRLGLGFLLRAILAKTTESERLNIADDRDRLIPANNSEKKMARPLTGQA